MKPTILVRTICIALSLLLMGGMMPAYTANAAASLDTARHWAETDIILWADAGVISYYPDGTFRPDEPITYGELDAMFNHFFGFTSPELGGASDKPVTREQAAAAIAGALQIDLGDTPSFADTGSIEKSLLGAVAAMQRKGYIKGKPGNRFDPKGEITRAEMCALLSRVAAVNQVDPISRPAAAPLPVPDKGAKPGAGEFVLLYDTAADLYVDKNDWEGVSIALTSLQSDIGMVGGIEPEIKNNASELANMAVLVGTIGKSAVIDKLVSDGKLDVSEITGKWESYVIKVLDNPVDGVDRALVIAGSDKRGTIYGIYKISELIGVSPWVWWADSVPQRNGKLTFDNSLSILQGEPSVKYRGIFLNDESPGLSGWTAANFGTVDNPQATNGYDHEFYSKVFELILRLKGNYLWPTMWNNSFHTDDPLNSVTADKYGIVMGTSHQEHMTCADKEWSWANLGAWNYFTNRDKVYDFWKNGVTERKNYESVLTIGMRGQADTSILGPNATLGDNMDLLKSVIEDQRQIITGVYGAPDAAPQLLALYKEVEDFYYGDEQFGKLEVPDDVTLLLCDDNFGNVRTLPTEEMRKRSGGFGMYYHFDYRGDPISYQWINQTPLTKVWEQMTTAYDAGVDRIWIVNVGDLKPMELPIDYFLNLAYDYEQWSPANKVDEFTRTWAANQFSGEFADAAADALNSYTKILGARKAEVVLPDPSTFSLTTFDEADTVLRAFEETVKTAEDVFSRMPYYMQDSFFQLVLYPARAAMNVYKANIYAAWSKFLAKEGLTAANEYAELARAAYDADVRDMDYYNKIISGGKWNRIMMQNHMGYTTWDGPSNGVIPSKMPDVGSVELVAGSELAVRVQNSTEIIRGSASDALPVFTNLNEETRYFDIFNGQSLPFPFTAKADADWVVLSTGEGVCVNQTRVGVSVDWSKVTADTSATITVSGADASVTINVTADMFTGSVKDNTYVETEGYVSINPARYTDNNALDSGKWAVIDGYGRDGDSVKVLPNGISYADAEKAPCLEYSFYIQTPGKYNVNTFIAPTTNAEHKTAVSVSEQLRFSVQIDDGELLTKSGMDNDFAAGASNSWRYGVECNTRMVTAEYGELDEGLHTLRIYAVDPGVVIQKIVIAPDAQKQTTLAGAPQTYHFMDSYFGPPESFYAGTAKTKITYPVLDSGIKQFSNAGTEVTFDPNTGAKAQKIATLPSNGSKLTAAQINSIPVPVLDGYVFLGWLMPNGAPLTDDIIFVEPTTVTASFISTSSITYAYFPNGGKGNLYESDIPAGKTMIISECKFTNDGKIFSHWNTKADGTGDTYSPGAESAALNEVNLHAIWVDAEPTIKTSSWLSGGNITNAFDGNNDTAWKAAGASNEWVEFELDGTYNIDSVQISESGNNIQDFEIFVRNTDDGNWETVLTGTGIGSNADLLFFAGKSVSTDKLRVHIKSAQKPPVINEVGVTPFTNWALTENGGEITTTPEGGEGEPSMMLDGDRVDYTKRWRVNSQEGFIDPITLILAEQKNISVINIFSVSSLWNTKPVDIRRDTLATTALGTIHNLTFEYTEDGENWMPLPGGEITENEYSLITLKLDAPVAMKGLRFIVPEQPNSDFSDSWIRIVEIETLELTEGTVAVTR